LVLKDGPVLVLSQRWKNDGCVINWRKRISQYVAAKQIFLFIPETNSMKISVTIY
jgi:hypothetical protein